MEDLYDLPINKRAERRQHRARLKVARRFYYGMDMLNKPTRLGKVVTTAAPCSCWMCCNQRRNGELTMQERRFQQREKPCCDEAQQPLS